MFKTRKLVNEYHNAKKDKENNLINQNKMEEQSEYIEYLEEQTSEQNSEIRNLKEKNNNLEEKMLSIDLELKKKDNQLKAKDEEIRLLIERTEYLEDLVNNYRNMPDLKNMIDNLSELTSPSIEKLAEVLKNSKFDDITQLEDKINDLTCMIREALHHMPVVRTYNL